MLDKAWEQFTLRVKCYMLNNLFISVNSFSFQQIENYQRRSLLVRRLVGWSAGPLERTHILECLIMITHLRISYYKRFLC